AKVEYGILVSADYVFVPYEHPQLVSGYCNALDLPQPALDGAERYVPRCPSGQQVEPQYAERFVAFDFHEIEIEMSGARHEPAIDLGEPRIGAVEVEQQNVP